jgi:hypothetical protein
VAFLPFGLLIDQWRWKVFAGEIQPADYNAAWWSLRERYQGVAAPGPRPPDAFDPGAKYHVPANTPYTRYFLARVLQFQFYRAMCREAGFTGPLHRCSFYGSRAAGAKLAAMLEAGQSRPWQETLYALTGERQMDAGAMAEYFAPLKAWLDRQNAGRPVGWGASGAGRADPRPDAWRVPRPLPAVALLPRPLAQQEEVHRLHLLARPRRAAQEAEAGGDARVGGEAADADAAAHGLPPEVVDQLGEHALQRDAVQRIAAACGRCGHDGPRGLHPTIVPRRILTGRGRGHHSTSFST